MPVGLLDECVYCSLCRYCEVDTFVDVLIQDGIITLDDLDFIMSHQLRNDRMRILFQILHQDTEAAGGEGLTTNSPQLVLGLFGQCLGSEQSFLQDKLQEACTDRQLTHCVCVTRSSSSGAGPYPHTQ